MLDFQYSYTVPGQTDIVRNTENVIWWGRESNLILRGHLIDGASVDAGKSPTDILRPGLIMGGPVSGKVKQWIPTDITGYQNVYGILMQEQKMEVNSVDTDRFGPLIMVGGPIKAGALIVPGEAAAGISGKDNEELFRVLTTGRFLLDDDVSNVYGNYGGWRQFVTKTAAYQILAADHNVCFNNIGDVNALVITLPAIATVGPGFRVGFMSCVDEDIVVTSADGDDIITDNDDEAGSVGISTTTEQIGTFLEFLAISKTKWFCIASIPAPTSAVGLTIVT